MVAMCISPPFGYLFSNMVINKKTGNTSIGIVANVKHVLHDDTTELYVMVLLNHPGYWLSAQTLCGEA